MWKLALAVVAVVVASVCPLPAPASADAICFQDQNGRVYAAYITNTFGQAVEVFIERTTTTGILAGFSTFFTGGAYMQPILGTAAVEAGGSLEGLRLTLNPPSFTSGTGQRIIYDTGSGGTAGSITALTISPATCLPGS
jgi:hypothetical protein